MTDKKWNMGTLKELMNHHSAALEPIMDRHPEMQGCGMGVDRDSGEPYFFLSLREGEGSGTADIPARVGTAEDGLDIRVEFRPQARLG